MLPDQVSNPGPLTYESGALPIALRGPAMIMFNLHKLISYFDVIGCKNKGKLDNVTFYTMNPLNSCDFHPVLGEITRVK